MAENVNDSVEILDIPIDEIQPDIEHGETVHVIEIETPQAVEVEVQEAFPATSSEVDERQHGLLRGRDGRNQHPIIAIEGLREELDNIKALKEKFSNKYGHADYYLWADGGDEIANRIGYFVSACEGDGSKIEVYSKGTVLGVVVDTAAFIGNRTDAVQTKCNICGHIMDEHRVICANSECQSTDVDYIRKIQYGLVATSGVVSVRCETDVVRGDYVMPNSHGVAAKVNGKYGYEVIEIDSNYDIPYAVINLDSSTSSVYRLGIETEGIESRVAVNERNIVSAINVANEAHNKSRESVAVSEEAVKKALEAVLKANEADGAVGDMKEILTSVSSTSAQAKAIAESAVTSAESMRNEAIAEANSAAAQVKNLTKTLEPLTTWTDPETGNIGASYLANYIDNGLATKAEIETVENNLEYATSVIQQNAKSIQSLVVAIDKHSVGPHSQAYGFTLEQAASVLEEGIIYAPTEEVTETYQYADEEGSEQTYERSFAPGYLYKWGKLADYPYGWITVDKDYNPLDEINDSSKAVYFTATEPIVSGNFGYWYTNGDTITSTTGAYEPYTLYKWESYENEVGDTQHHWVAVATLAGNSSNRAVSQIRQDANSIEMRVTNAEGSAASSKQWIDDNSANIQDVVSWKSDNGENLVTFMQTADENYASASQVAQIVDKDGNVNAASIVTAVTKDESSIALLADKIVLDADNINFTATADYSVVAENITLRADKLDFGGNGTKEIKLDADNINFDGSEFASKVSQTYSTKDEMQSAKEEAINSANSSTNDKLKNYCTTTKTQSLIDQKADSIALSVQHSIDDIEIGGRNLASSNTISHTSVTFNSTVDTNSKKSWNLTKNSGYGGTKINKDVFSSGETYTLSYSFKGIEGALQNIGGHSADFTFSKIVLDGEQVSSPASAYVAGIPVDEDGSESKPFKEHNIVLTFTVNATVADDENIYIQPNRGLATEITYELWGIKLEKGNKATDWTPAPEDMATAAELKIANDKISTKVESSTYNSKMEQLDKSISTKVENTATGTNCSWTMKPENFKVSAVAEGKTGGITVDSNGLTVNGIINAQAGGTIGGWDIDNNSIYKDSVRLTTSNSTLRESLVNSGETSPVRIKAGAGVVADKYTGSIPNQTEFTVRYNTGVSDATNVNVIIADVQDTQTDLTITDTRVEAADDGIDVIVITLKVNNSNNNYVGCGYILEISYSSSSSSSSFCVLNDGSMYASGANIAGEINATTGKIGDLFINGRGLTNINETGTGFTINESGITFYDDKASLSFGDNFKINTRSTGGEITATGPLEIRGQNTFIQLNDNTDNTIYKRYCVCANYHTKSEGTRKLNIWLKAADDDYGNELLYDQEITLTWNSSIIKSDGTLEEIANGVTATTWKKAFIDKSVEQEITFTTDHAWYDIRFNVMVTIQNYINGLYYFKTNDDGYGKGNTFELKKNLVERRVFVQYQRGENIRMRGNVIPYLQEGHNLGDGDHRWNTIYAKDSSISSSDGNLKNNIEPLNSQYSQLFDLLSPVSYKFNKNESNRTHTGLIAQDVKTAVESVGLTTQDFAGYCEWKKEDGTIGCGLRYGEFIALCIDEIQKLKKRVVELEKEKNK